MANSYFQFKQFTIHQNKSAMKVGTDGVLLGAWANCKHAKQILDIGTGTGLIALMLAQKSDAIIDAIEIDNDAAEEAQQNVLNSKWQNRIKIINDSLQNYMNGINKYDLIVSNPPYFNQSKKANTISRTNARHDDNLSTNDLFTAVDKMLNDKGIFCVIIPTEIHDKYLQIAKTNNLNISKKLWIKPTPEFDAKRVLLELKKQNCKCEEETLIIEEFGRHKYSEKYKELTKDFYLAF